MALLGCVSQKKLFLMHSQWFHLVLEPDLQFSHDLQCLVSGNLGAIAIKWLETIENPLKIIVFETRRHAKPSKSLVFVSFLSTETWATLKSQYHSLSKGTTPGKLHQFSLGFATVHKSVPPRAMLCCRKVKNFMIFQIWSGVRLQKP